MKSPGSGDSVIFSCIRRKNLLNSASLLSIVSHNRVISLQVELVWSVQSSPLSQNEPCKYKGPFDTLKFCTDNNERNSKYTVLNLKYIVELKYIKIEKQFRDPNSLRKFQTLFNCFRFNRFKLTRPKHLIAPITIYFYYCTAFYIFILFPYEMRSGRHWKKLYLGQYLQTMIWVEFSSCALEHLLVAHPISLVAPESICNTNFDLCWNKKSKYNCCTIRD